MTERNKLNRMIKEMTRLKPKQEHKQRKNPLEPDKNSMADIATLKDKLFDSIKLSNLLKSDIKTKYKRVLANTIPKLNAANRSSRRSGKWLEILNVKINFDEHGRTEIVLIGKMQDDDYLNKMSEDNYDEKTLKDFKKTFDISTLTITGKSDYNEFEVE